MNSPQLDANQLLARWLVEYAASLPPHNGILRVRRAEPRPATRNFFDRFKVETAKFDGTGQNPTDIGCIVVEVSETDQTAKVAPATACNSIKDL